MPTPTVENYLKQLYLEQQTDASRPVPMGKLAGAMRVVPGTATTMVKTLADAGLVEYEPRGGARLTPSGEQLALHVLRRHRLVELFLVKVLGLDWSEVHPEAEELEHAISDKVLDKIDLFLGRPSVDPHGDPIPTATGAVAPTGAQTSLMDCQTTVPLRVARILDQGTPFLRFVDRAGLTPGTPLTVAPRDEAADAVTVHPDRHPAVTLGRAAADKILVEPVAAD